jgi:hypothetical protein
MNSTFYTSTSRHSAEWSVVPKSESERRNQVVVPKESPPHTRSTNRSPENTQAKTTAALFAGIDVHCNHALKQLDVSCLFPGLQCSEVYELWVQLDLLPAFMRGVINVTMPEIFAIPWALNIRNQKIRWEAWTTDRVPRERIAWRNLDGEPYPNHGSVCFGSVGHSAARLSISVRFDGPNAELVDDRTLNAMVKVFQNAMVALRILAHPTNAESREPEQP